MLPQTPAPQVEPPAPTPPENVTFEGWLSGQDETVKGLYTAHTAGLKSALDGERAANKAAQGQLRELAKKADKGSELEAALTKQADQYAALEKQAAFQDKAHAAGVRSLKLAFLAANQADMVDDKGNCDFAKLRTEYPELFAAKIPPANGGEGTQSQPTVNNINSAIRRAAGFGQ